jgi:hypothetical protein
VGIVVSGLGLGTLVYSPLTKLDGFVKSPELPAMIL